MCRSNYSCILCHGAGDLLPYVMSCVRFLISWWHFTLLLFTSRKARPILDYTDFRDAQRCTCNQSFATEFISVVLQDLPWNRGRKLQELKWVLANKLFLVNWWGISVRQGMWWSLYELSQQKQIHPLHARVSQVHLSSQDPWYHRQNRVMKWLLAILICHIRVVIIIIIIRIFFSRLTLCSWKRWNSSSWFWLAFSKVGQVGSVLFRLIFHRGSLVCPETPFSRQFCILQSFLPIFACAGPIQWDLSLTKPGHDVSRALGVLLYIFGTSSIASIIGKLLEAFSFLSPQESSLSAELSLIPNLHGKTVL